VKSAGLVDLQVNGFAGLDFNAGEFQAGALEQALEAVLATGVTTLLPTLITATPEQLESRFLALDAAISASPLGRIMCPGYHLEGPFLNPAQGYAGCHPATAMTVPDYALVARLERQLSRPILLLTLAPELPGAAECIRRARTAGKLVGIGHSAANFAEVAAAADAGAGMSTHLGNGLPQSLHKLDNTLFAQLAEDRLAAGLIADGIHLHPQALKVLLRAKGDRALLVTDAVAAAAAPPGRYPFAGMEVERGVDGSVRVPGGTGLAGSSLCLDAAMRNLLRWGLADAAEALEMASSRPAALLAPALAAHGLTLPPAELLWSDALALRQLRLGLLRRDYLNPTQAPQMETDHAG
jgi:N-acetylglucosamine-6-phosphate deacetylase